MGRPEAGAGALLFGGSCAGLAAVDGARPDAFIVAQSAPRETPPPRAAVNGLPLALDNQAADALTRPPPYECEFQSELVTNVLGSPVGAHLNKQAHAARVFYVHAK